MALEKIPGKNVFLFRNTGTEEAPVYKLMVCLTENGLTGDTEVVEANSKCGADSVPGDTTFTSAFSGLATLSPGASSESINEVLDLFQDKTVAQWVITDDAAEPTIWRAFKGWISSYEETYNNGESVAFSGTLTIIGEVDRTIPEVEVG